MFEVAAGLIIAVFGFFGIKLWSKNKEIDALQKKDEVRKAAQERQIDAVVKEAIRLSNERIKNAPKPSGKRNEFEGQ